MGCPVGYEFGAKPNVITWDADIFLSIIKYIIYNKICTSILYSSVATSKLFLSLFWQEWTKASSAVIVVLILY
jgi:hypothetical protein